LWVSHFLGEQGLGQWSQIHWVRVNFMLIGFGVFGALAFLRGRFLRFPIHPIGYLVVLFSIYYLWVSPYFKGDPSAADETTLIWGSVFFAWLIKKLVIKYGGMHSYKQAKPLFIGLVVGSVFCIFMWNSLDLFCSLGASETDPSDFVKHFLEQPPYSPRFY
jgi:hypothetical protein